MASLHSGTFGLSGDSDFLPCQVDKLDKAPLHVSINLSRGPLLTLDPAADDERKLHGNRLVLAGQTAAVCCSTACRRGHAKLKELRCPVPHSRLASRFRSLPLWLRIVCVLLVCALTKVRETALALLLHLYSGNAPPSTAPPARANEAKGLPARGLQVAAPVPLATQTSSSSPSSATRQADRRPSLTNSSRFSPSSPQHSVRNVPPSAVLFTAGIPTPSSGSRVSTAALRAALSASQPPTHPPSPGAKSHPPSPGAKSHPPSPGAKGAAPKRPEAIGAAPKKVDGKGGQPIPPPGIECKPGNKFDTTTEKCDAACAETSKKYHCTLCKCKTCAYCGKAQVRAESPQGGNRSKTQPARKNRR